MKSSHRTLVVSGLVGAAVLVTGAVMAGGTYYAEVSLTGTATTGSASGTLTTARRSADSNQWILCGVTATAASSYVQCSAKNAAGTFRSCTSTSASLVNTALGMTSYGALSFHWDNGACTQISVTSGSRFLP